MPLPSEPVVAEDDVDRWPGRVAFGLALVSMLTYYATSLGVRHFVAFVVDNVGRALRAFGHGA